MRNEVVPVGCTHMVAGKVVSSIVTTGEVVVVSVGGLTKLAVLPAES